MEEVVKVTRNYQITIPATIRKNLNIKEGDYVKVVYDEKEGVIKIYPIKRKRRTIKLGKRVSPENIETLIEEMLNEGAP
ncbi:AbrB family transcriptional regulator [Ignicoccus pacificus DSM 13166]|uniref:AbrB family transcriptional regulator n=1 Tax=Ignicoccus pacificus DSM 13166 TaxID=940294 RepID=A0A977PKA6_9CREN|nr:AbrB family transcriptional regulator [Ignicoccus pacificus DSM 13166]